MVAKGEADGGGKDCEFGINRGKRSSIGWTHTEVLLYSTGRGEKAGEEEEEQGDDEKEGRGRLESEEEEWGEEGEGRKARRRTMGRKAAGCGGGR